MAQNLSTIILSVFGMWMSAGQPFSEIIPLFLLHYKMICDINTGSVASGGPKNAWNGKIAEHTHQRGTATG